MLALRRFRDYASLVKFSHTIFAMPFAFAAVTLSLRHVPFSWRKLGWIVVCLISARTAAMAFNRLVDRRWDALNPRTRDRELPAGVLSSVQVTALVWAASAVFVVAAAQLGRLPLMLSPVALGLALGYSLVKRFSWGCHMVLGVAVAFAPGGAWIAMGAPVGLAPWLLVAAVAMWVAGFDVLYALQDRQFDRQHGLFSIPARWGVHRSLWASAALHMGTVACLVGVGIVTQRGGWYGAGVATIAALLLVEHALVHRHGLSKINKAFFDVNGYVSVVFFLCVLLDQIVSG
jgi:4-hydroxybenzoate polyprenyltransferase